MIHSKIYLIRTKKFRFICNSSYEKLLIRDAIRLSLQPLHGYNHISGLIDNPPTSDEEDSLQDLKYYYELMKMEEKSSFFWYLIQ